MKKLIILIFALVFAVNTFASEPGTIIKTGKFKTGISYSIKITQKNFVKTPDSKEDDGSVWGIDGGFPNTIIKDLALDINSVAVTIPWKFYYDITNISTVNFEEHEKFFILSIRGGDAAGSYLAEFKIKNYRLVERTVRVGEFPDEVWEKIILHNELWDRKDM